MKQIIFLFVLFFSFLIIFPNYVLAAKYRCANSTEAPYESIDDCNNSNKNNNNCGGCVEATTDTPSSANAPVRLPNPINIPNDDKDNPIPYLLGKIITSVMGIIGSLALVMFIYGGASWMLSGGNQEQVTKGKNILIWATAGLVIIFTAYALVKFVLTTVTMTS